MSGYTVNMRLLDTDPVNAVHAHGWGSVDRAWDDLMADAERRLNGAIDGLHRANDRYERIKRAYDRRRAEVDALGRDEAR